MRGHRERIATVLPGGFYYDGPRDEIEVLACCCDSMERTWKADIIGPLETELAIFEVTVDREADPRMVRHGQDYPIPFCPFCGVEIEFISEG